MTSKAQKCRYTKRASTLPGKASPVQRYRLSSASSVVLSQPLLTDEHILRFICKEVGVFALDVYTGIDCCMNVAAESMLCSLLSC